MQKAGDQRTQYLITGIQYKAWVQVVYLSAAGEFWLPLVSSWVLLQIIISDSDQMKSILRIYIISLLIRCIHSKEELVFTIRFAKKKKKCVPGKGSWNTKNTSVFYRSSRVLEVINDTLLSRQIGKQSGVELAGFNSGLFFSNCLLADAIIKRNGNKIVFIELPLFAGIWWTLYCITQVTNLDLLSSMVQSLVATGF